MGYSSFIVSMRNLSLYSFIMQILSSAITTATVVDFMGCSDSVVSQIMMKVE